MASGSLTTGVEPVYNARYCSLSWWESGSGDNYTDISWSCSIGGGTATYWYITPGVYFNWQGGQSSSSVTVLGWSSSRQQYPGTIGSGSFRVYHKSDGSATLSIQLYAAIAQQTYNCSASNSWSLPNRTTACGAPSSIVINKTFITPSSPTFTISWSGASSGTNNAITGFQIFYKLSTNGTKPTTSDTYKTYSTSSGSGSYTITLTDTEAQNRGYKIVAGVRTIGAKGSSFYSGLATGGSCQINNLPSVPTITSDKIIVPSTGGTITVSAEPGADNDSIQTKTVYFSTSITGTKQEFSQFPTDPIETILAGESITYYFWTYDGYEYSSSTSKLTLSRNLAPTINLVDANIQTYYALGTNGIEGKRLGWSRKFQPTFSVNKPGTLKIKILSGYEPNTADDFSETAIETYTFSITSSGQYTPATINATIFNDITKNTNNIYWIFSYEFYDDLESTTQITYPSNGQFYSIAKVSNILAIYNQFNNENVSGTLPNQIDQNIRLKLYRDSSFESFIDPYTVYLQGVNTTQYNLKIEKVTSDVNYIYCDCSLLNQLPLNTDFSVYFTWYYSISPTYKTTVTTETTTIVSKTKTPNLSNFTIGAEQIKPFTQVGIFNINSTWPFGDAENLAEGFTNYNCASDAIKIHMSRTKLLDSDIIIELPSGTEWSKVNDTLSTVLNTSTLFDWSDPLGYKPYSGIKKYYLKLEITNLFGNVYISNWAESAFNFNEGLEDLTISSVQWSTTSTDTTTWKDFTLGENGNQIQESLYLKFNGSFKGYTTDALDFKLYLNNGESEFSTSEFNWTSSTGSRAIDRTIVENSFSFIYGPVKELTTSFVRNWYFTIQNSLGIYTSNTIQMAVARHTNPQPLFNKCEIVVDSSGDIKTAKYTYNGKYSDATDGFSVLPELSNGWYSITSNLYSKKYNSILSTELLILNNIDNIVKAQNEWDHESLSICIQTSSIVSPIDPENPTTSGPLIKQEKTYYSNVIIVYQLAPTLVYRKNSIGMNVTDPGENEIITISEASGKYLLLFKGKINKGESTYDVETILDVSKGLLNTNTYDVDNGNALVAQFAIDLVNGILS